MCHEVSQIKYEAAATPVSYLHCAQVWEAARKLLAKPRQLAQQEADLQVGVRGGVLGARADRALSHIAH